MNKMKKWAITLAPFVLMGCSDTIETTVTPAKQGDDVQFTVGKTPETRTMYSEPWAESGTQQIYWGNYSNADEFINIYCPDNPGRGFAKYKVNLQQSSSNVAESVVKFSEIGVQWGTAGTEHTFYAFYPADKASESLTNGSTIRATVVAAQSPLAYRYKEHNVDTENSNGELKDLDIAKYNTDEYDATNNKVNNQDVSKTIYGQPQMEAAVMVARSKRTAEQYGLDVPLQFNVLADVLDITLNGPVSPNSLGGNANADGTGGIAANFIQIQSVSLEVVTPTEPYDPNDQKTIAGFPINHEIPIAGSFDLDMSEDAVGTSDMIKNVSGNAIVQLQTAIVKDDKTYYPTLFVRSTLSDTDRPSYNQIDHLRLRAFLIPNQITAKTLKTLRVHLQTNCGDFYKMLSDDESSFASGKIYPVKLGYFKKRGEDFDLSRWIGQLNPDIYLSELSIPGAWHAANSTFQGNHDLKEMYKAGVRAFEVHTKNGPVLRKYGDMDTEFNINESKDDFEEPFTYTINAGETLVLNHGNPQGSGSGTIGSWSVNGTTYNRRRAVTAANAIAIQGSSTTSVQLTVPKFWIRLYRTQDASNTEPLSTAIINLHSIMNADGLMFLEIGMEAQSGINNAPYKSIRIGSSGHKVQHGPISGYQYGYFSWGDGTTWYNVYDWTTNFQNTNTETSTVINENGTFNLSGEEAWAIAVRSCFERLANNDVLYEGDLTRSTTIKNVKGKIIAKVNTNSDENEKHYLWGSTPALFSRWIDGSAKTPLTINLKWKSPVAPYEGNTGKPAEGDENLRWCFSELDNIGGSLDNRKSAIIAMNDTAYENYNGGRHRTFYESSLGGYLNWGQTVDNCLSVAKGLNPYVLNRLNNPSRKNVPLGLVFMNYVIPPTGEEDACKSAELIRAIVNNNKAFLLHRSTDGK